jgi:hypothetical protein
MPTRFTPSQLEFITSERFIHQDLAERAAAIAEQAREVWKKTQRIEPYAVTWPSTALKTDDGGVVDQAVICQLPLEYTDAQRTDVLHKMVEKTKAYGLVLVEQRGNQLRVLFETHHGARAWLMRLERHGDVVVCGAPEIREDADCLGILWRAQRGVG